MFIYFWDRERQGMNGGGAEREGDTESETGSRLWAISPEPDAGLEFTDREIVRSWPGWSRMLNRLRHPGAPVTTIFKTKGNQSNWAADSLLLQALLILLILLRVMSILVQ